MGAMVLATPGRPLCPAELPDPTPAPGEVLRVRACGICRTDLHLRDGELEPGHLPLVLGHQIVGEVLVPDAAATHAAGARGGVPWLGWTCGVCRFCRSGRENLCERARFTGKDLDGGFAELAVADARFCLSLPPEAAPSPARATTPATVVCAGIHLSNIPSFPYEDLWHERSIRSVANLTRADGAAFLALAPQVPIRTTVTTYELSQAEQALTDLRAGAFEGSAVLVYATQVVMTGFSAL